MEYVIILSLAVLVFLGSTMGSIAGNMIASELYDRAPSLAAWLIEQAVRGLPEHERERYREEWLAHLDEYPGKLSRVWHSVGCFFGAGAVAQAAAMKRPTTYTRDRQHQTNQEERVRERGRASISGPTYSVVLESPVGAGKKRVFFNARYLSESDVMSVISEEMNRDADIVDHTIDLIRTKFRTGGDGADEN